MTDGQTSLFDARERCEHPSCGHVLREVAWEVKTDAGVIVVCPACAWHYQGKPRRQRA